MAKIVIEPGKTMASPKALAKQLLGGKAGNASQSQIVSLTQKIKRLNPEVITKKGQDLTSGTILKVGKVTTKRLGTLVDPSETNKYSFVPKSQTTSQGQSTNESSSTNPAPRPEPDNIEQVDVVEQVVPPVKSAPIDTIVFLDDNFIPEQLEELLFENVGGQELLSIARNDTVNGQSVIYQPFKNLGILQEIYNPTSLLKLQETSDKFFSNFLINLRSKIPYVGNGLNGLNYYLDLANGNGIIELINMRPDEQVEIQIATAGIIEDVGI